MISVAASSVGPSGPITTGRVRSSEPSPPTFAPKPDACHPTNLWQLCLRHAAALPLSKSSIIKSSCWNIHCIHNSTSKTLTSVSSTAEFTHSSGPHTSLDDFTHLSPGYNSQQQQLYIHGLDKGITILGMRIWPLFTPGWRGENWKS